MEWTELVKYIDTTALVVLLILFARGQIVSKKTMQDLNIGHRESTKELKNSFESTVKLICDSHEKQIKIMTTSFTKQISSLKAVIQIMKKSNGIK